MEGWCKLVGRGEKSFAIFLDKVVDYFLNTKRGGRPTSYATWRKLVGRGDKSFDFLDEGVDYFFKCIFSF